MKKSNMLFYGDNLDVLREHTGDESVDLVYLDPPFKSNRDYKIITGQKSKSKKKAFEDTWKWNGQSAKDFSAFVQNAPEDISRTMFSLRTLLGDSNMLAYLTMMAPRLVELRRVGVRIGETPILGFRTARPYVIGLVVGELHHPNAELVEDT